MNTDNKKNCGACRWWSPLTGPDFERQPFIGVCGHRDNAGGATDRVDTCEDFEAEDEDVG